jgi:hypothetical protein
MVRSYAVQIERLVGHCFSAAAGLTLLHGPIPSARDCLLDAHSRLLATHLHGIGGTLRAVTTFLKANLSEAPGIVLSQRAAIEEVNDAVALWLLEWLKPRPELALRLAVATARLLEDGPMLLPQARRLRPLGRGFERLFKERWRRRFALLPDHREHLLVPRKHLMVLMQEPDQGLARVEEDLGRPLSGGDRRWLEAERQVAMLRFVRRSKTDGGHIRWYLKKDSHQRVVLASYGTRGHRVVPDKQGRTIVDPPPTPDELVLRADDTGVRLLDGGSIIAQSRYGAEEDELLSFLEVVECVGDLHPPVDRMGERDDREVSLIRAIVRAATSNTGKTLRLLYVPSAIEHELGGSPLIGLDFLRDRMEREGTRVRILTLPCHEFHRRRHELLGADAVGIGVYIHNVAEVAELVALLRESGYRGRIVLGGPQLRDIDQVWSAVKGWDALIRGEAEDVLPEVLEILDDVDGLLDRVHSLRGVAIRNGRSLILCDTATRNRAGSIRCPLPFQWMRGKAKRMLQMNFTRGCPYLCTFCPNHQGQLYRAGPIDELWRYTVLAAADDLELPAAVEHEVLRRIEQHVGLDSVSLPMALHLLLRTPCDATALRRICEPLAGPPDAFELSSPRLVPGPLTPWQIKQYWLHAKAAVLATVPAPDKPPFVLMTSEDNTLVNRATIREYLRLRKRHGLDRYVVFNPGQNTVWDLTDGAGNADETYIAELVDGNPFAVALGVDGPSNPVIRQNRKPRYGVQEVLAVNRALAKHGVRVANNYIMLTPETDLLEAVEAFALFLLLPISWRDYGQSINLRVIKEPGTLAHDEGLLFAPNDEGYDEPLRFREVRDLLSRWGLSSRVSTADIRPLLWRMLREDRVVAARLPHVVQRWRRDYDADPELAALGELLHRQARMGVPLVDTFSAVSEQLRASFPGECHRRVNLQEAPCSAAMI